jgi:hypothetical protein
VYIDRDEAIDRGTKPSIADTASMANTPIGERGWLGNSYPKEMYGREECIELFREAFTERLNTDEEFRMAVAAIAGDILGGWCQRLDADGPACHSEVIAKHADRLAGEIDD